MGGWEPGRGGRESGHPRGGGAPLRARAWTGDDWRDTARSILSATCFSGEPRRLFSYDGELYLITRSGPTSHELERLDPASL